MLLGSITPYIGSDPGSHRHHLGFMLRHLTNTVGMVIARVLLVLRCTFSTSPQSMSMEMRSEGCGSSYIATRSTGKKNHDCMLNALTLQQFLEPI
jgi:hypothetical protein